MFHSKRLSVLLASALLILNGLSCAPADTVTITLVPSSGYTPKKFHELYEEFFQQELSSTFSLLSSANSCRQMHVRLAFSQMNSNGESIQTIPFTEMRTLVPAPTPPVNFDAAWMNTPGNVEFAAPLRIDVPKGSYTEVGLFGAINPPVDSSPDDDYCDNIIGGVPQPSYTMMGHTAIGTPSAAMTVPLKVYFFNATPPNPTPTPPTYTDGHVDSNSPGAYYCSDYTKFETCPVRDMIDVKNVVTGSPAYYCKILRIRYFHGSNGTAPIDHLLNDTTTISIGAHFYLPHSKVYELVVYKSSNFATQATILMSENDSLTGINLPAGVCDTNNLQTISIGKIQ